jgi:isohexenylglutaconyl-CoA hydratase
VFARISVTDLMGSDCDQPVRLDRNATALIVTMSRPHVRNAIDEAMLSGLERACDEAAADSSISTVLFRSDGHVFSAGGDLKERGRLIADGSRNALTERSRREGLLLARLARLPTIVMAAVEGGAIGLAFGIVAVADLVLAARPAVFGAPEVMMGAMPAQILPFVVDRISLGQARRLLVTGALVDADEAFRLGIVHDVLADRGALERTIADRLAALCRIDRAAVAATKRLLNRAERSDTDYISKAAESYAELIFRRPDADPPQS